EGQMIGEIKRVVGLAADHLNVPIVQRECHRARNILLGLVNKPIKRLAQWSEPEPEVSQLRILQSNVLLEMHEVSVQAQGLEFTMCRNQQSSAWCFITAAGFDTHTPVFYYISSADGIPPPSLIQQFD